MSAPLTLASPELEFDYRRYTATAILNPAIVLLGAGSHLDFLLVRDHEIADETTLVAVRRIRLPHGWRCRATEFAARFIRVRVPDERLYNEVSLAVVGRSHVASVRGADQTLAVADKLFALRPVTGNEYRRLSRMRGRELRRQVMRMFHRQPGVMPQFKSRPLNLLRRWVPLMR